MYKNKFKTLYSFKQYKKYVKLKFVFGIRLVKLKNHFVIFFIIKIRNTYTQDLDVLKRSENTILLRS